MSKRNSQRALAAASAISEPLISAEATEQPRTPVKPLQMRLGAGRYAVKAAEVEIHVDGARLTGGNGIVEFDLSVETWLDIVVIRT